MKPITRAFLNRLANRIYDPKKPERYLRLCKGTLANWPDPENKRRRMHCGLGELYFAATGKQPDEIDEYDVCRVITNGTELVPGSEQADDFLDAIEQVPYENDCSSGYKTRARRVAKLLRKAAGFLK